MTSPATQNNTQSSGRHLAYWAFAVVVVGYLAIIQLGGMLVPKVTGGGDSFTSTSDVLLASIPLAVALIFAWGVIAYLGWRQPVLHDDHPVQRWVRVVPIVFIVGILLATNYGALAQQGLAFTLVLLLATQLVGWGEESMFRGLGVVMLRDHNLSEGKVALWSSLIFGAVHLSNGITHGVSALPQAAIVSLAGYFFYLIRRFSRGNVLNSVLHGLFDFSLLSGTAILVDQPPYAGPVASILVYVVLIVILLIRRRSIEPATATG